MQGSLGEKIGEGVFADVHRGTPHGANGRSAAQRPQAELPPVQDPANAPTQAAACVRLALNSGARADVSGPPLWATSGLVRRSKRSRLIRRFGTEHVISCQRTSNTFQCELTHRLDRDRVFDRRENARTD
jgi:hypothetical protein